MTAPKNYYSFDVVDIASVSSKGHLRFKLNEVRYNLVRKSEFTKKKTRSASMGPPHTRQTYIKNLKNALRLHIGPMDVYRLINHDN